MRIKINGTELGNTDLIVLLASTIATLSSGTNYVVGSYAPQLREALHLSSAQINFVASCGNFGVYLTGPVFGLIADLHGTRALLFIGSFLLGFGYLGLYWAYTFGDNTDPPFFLLTLFSFATGLGSCLGNTAGLRTVAKAFPPASRGLAMGIVVAGYGLSAFVYATISGLIIGDNTGAFLMVLALGTFASLFGAAILLTPERTEYGALGNAASASASSLHRAEYTRLRRSSSSHANNATPEIGIFGGESPEAIWDDDERHGKNERTTLTTLPNDSSLHIRRLDSNSSETTIKAGSDRTLHGGGTDLEAATGTIRSNGHMETPGHSSIVTPLRKSEYEDEQGNVSPLGLFRIPDYYLLMVVMFCATGTGLMWINNVGTVVVTLAQFNNTPGKITRLQSHQTSLLSLFNCLGRLFAGACSDQARIRYGIKTVWFLILMSFSFIISQILARNADNLSDLSWATSFVGFSYGQFFGLAPIVMLEWFGLKYFSANVGALYMVPTFSSYTFSHLFGSIYDASMPVSDDVISGIKRILTRSLRSELWLRALSASDDTPAPHTHTCPLGKECYSRVFSYTIPACILAAGLSTLLAVRRGKGLEEKAKAQHSPLPQEEGDE